MYIIKSTKQKFGDLLFFAPFLIIKSSKRRGSDELKWKQSPHGSSFEYWGFIWETI